MKKPITNIYDKCVELSKKNSKSSLLNLFNIYLNSQSDVQKIAKRCLKKSGKRALILEILDSLIDEATDENRIYNLLNLGFYISKTLYLKRYIKFLRDKKYNLKDNLLVPIKSKTFFNVHKSLLADYMIENSDYTQSLYKLLDEENASRVLDGLYNFVNVYGVSSSALTLLSNNLKYIELLQPNIREAISKNVQYDFLLFKYLDFSISENYELLRKTHISLEQIYLILKSNCFLERINNFKDFEINVAFHFVKKIKLSTEDWNKAKNIIINKINKIDNLLNHIDFLTFLTSTVHQERSFVEKILIDLYKKSKLYTNVALKLLKDIKSNFAYREMINFMLSTEDRKERFSYAIELMKTYPENGTSIYSYAKQIKDEKLLETLMVVAQKYNISISFSDKYKHIDLTNKTYPQIITKNIIISEFLIDLAQEINANKFIAAVGFTYASGLRMLFPLFDFLQSSNSCSIELLTGSLQNFENQGKSAKIDKNTVILLNKLIENYNLKLFTYNENFYHGKFYYLANDKNAYIIIGSSNISKTAYLDNYELNSFITIDLTEKIDKYMEWYEEFKNNCVLIKSLNPDWFIDYKWESELDVYGSIGIKKLSCEDVSKEIMSLTDEETKFRLNSWLSHNPSEIFGNLCISSLQEYIVFLFAEYGLAVFESFIPGNAYYTFKYFDFDDLIRSVSTLTKSQMLLSSSFLSRGYHISDKDKLETKINRLFENHESSMPENNIS